MNAEELVSYLITADVIAQPAGADDGDDGLRLTEAFERAIVGYRERLSTGDEDAEDRAIPMADHPLIDGLAGVGGTAEHILPEYCALVEFLEDAPTERLVALAIVVNQFDPVFPPADGTPEQFVPVHADRLPIITKVFDRAVVYVWRHECEPCDLVKEDLNDLVTTSNVPMLAVFGPDWAEFVSDEYDVEGGPTTLFFVDGSVDMRLQGAYPREALRNVLADFSPMISLTEAG